MSVFFVTYILNHLDGVGLLHWFHLKGTKIGLWRMIIDTWPCILYSVECIVFIAPLLNLAIYHCRIVSIFWDYDHRALVIWQLMKKSFCHRSLRLKIVLLYMNNNICILKGVPKIWSMYSLAAFRLLLLLLVAYDLFITNKSSRKRRDDYLWCM